ncbi:uncharacterized protein [Parasteatoda tepidariorum]|uniref:uncharacterized protein n=1 Tax=Parasteatoda tepidariorum TaxID=114398 RepID=UPI001C71F369|nr:serine-rich adhesin for platelets-like [Parasteatoda tepidariorum]
MQFLIIFKSIIIDLLNYSRSDNENGEDLASEEEISVVKKKRTAPKNSQSKINWEFAAPEKNRRKRILVAKVQKRGRAKRIAKRSGQTKDSASNSETISSCNGGNSVVEMDSSDGISVNISDSDSIKRLIKECNVCLNSDEIEQYGGTFPLRMNNVSPMKRKRGGNNSLVLNSHSLKNGTPSFQNNLRDSEVSKSAGRSSNRKRVASPEKESPTNNKKSDNGSREDLANKEEISVVKKKKTTPKNSHQNQSNGEFAVPRENQSKRVTEVQNGSVRKRDRPKRITKKRGRTKVGASNSETISSDEGGNSDVQMDSSDGISVNISDSDSIKRLIKECNVCLNSDEIEEYAGTFTLRLNNVSPIKRKRGKNSSLVLNSQSLKNGAPSFQNNLSDSEVSERTGRSSNRKRVASPEKELPTNNKKKKDTAPLLHSLRSNASSSAVEEESSQTASSSISDTKESSSVDSIQSFTSIILKNASKKSGVASVIVQNSQNNAVWQNKSKILFNQINESVEENSLSRKEKPVTRSHKVTSSIKTTNSFVTRASARTAKNKMIEAKSRPKQR